MAYTAPPGYPLSLPQRSRRYWDAARSGSSACAGSAPHTSSPAISSTRMPRRRRTRELWEVLEAFNHHLDVPRRRLDRISEVVEVQVNALVSGHRNAGGELVLGNSRNTGADDVPPNGPELRLPGLPPEHVRQPACRRSEAKHVGGDVIRLHDKLRVRVRAIAPPADLDGELPVILPRAFEVPRQQAQGRSRVEVRSLAHDKGIRAIAERRRQRDLRARPPAVSARKLQMERAVVSDPRVVGVVLVGATPITRGLTDVPLVAAERQPSGGLRYEIATAPGGRHGQHRAARGRQPIDCRR